MRRLFAREAIGPWLLVLGTIGLGWFLAHNAALNMAKRGMNFGFAFLGKAAGFDISFHLIDWATSDTYARALLVCLFNTLLVSIAGIVATSILGLLLGLMRLSANWLARTTAGSIIELIRNTPQLLQIIFWYVGVLQLLPQMRQSLVLPGNVFLNVRGLFVPWPVLGEHGLLASWLVVAAIVAVPFLWVVRYRDQQLGGAALAPLFAAIVYWLGTVERLDVPALKGFNFTGGAVIPPELVALWAGLSIYAAGFIAEIVRSSIEGVPHGQHEAARSLGLRPGPIMFLVVLPQALRLMIPPLTSQYLNLIKSSSLGAAIAYPEIVQIFAGTVLNQSGRAIEVMVIVMGVFLAINLAASALMNLYNRRVMLVER